MADDEDMEEALMADPSESEIPELPGQSGALIVPPSMESSRMTSKTQSSSLIVLASMESSKMTSKTQSASLTGTATLNSEHPSGVIIKRNSQTSGSTVQNGSRDQMPLEEAARSKEGLRKSQELQLNGKKPSLDQLGTDKPHQSLKTRPARLHRQCQRRFREIIGKRELKNEELEKQEGDLRQRLNILECSMPAVMVWNIWRMTQCPGSGPSLQRVLEKQFQGPASGEVYCPSTPSRHFDCRVREVEAERKQAQKRAEEAQTLWTEKMATLEEREKKLEEARKVQEEQKVRIQQLTAEAKKLKEAASVVEDDGSCETGECAVIECKKKWLEKVPSSASIKSTDLECLDKLQQLAETELCMKRQIADLERREEAYMRTLQQADEMWLKIESDAASTMSAMQEQLDSKTAANQQLQEELELLRARMATCRTELEKYMSIGKIEALIGRDDDFAEVTDRGAAAGVKMRYRMSGREDDFADVEDKDSLMREEMSEKDIMARPDLSEVGIGVEPIVSDMTMMAKDEMADKDSLARPDGTEAGFRVHPDVSDLTTTVGPDDFTLEESRLNEARAYLARLGSLSALEGHEDYICPPDFACNDLVFTETGLTEEELTALNEGRVTAKMLLGQAAEALVEGTPGVMMRTAQFGASVGESVPQEFETRTPGEDAPSVVDAVQEMGLSEDIRPPDLKEDVLDTAVFDENLGREDLIATEMQTESPPTVSELSENNILVSRAEMLKWQQDVDLIRVTIAKCPDCVVVKKDADKLAETIAQYTDTEAKEVVDEHIPREKEVDLEREIVPEKPTESEVEVDREEGAVEIEEAEVTAAEVLPPEVSRIEIAEEVSDVVEKEATPAAEEVVAAVPESELAEMEEEEVTPVERDKRSAVEVEKDDEKVEVDYEPEPPTAELEGEVIEEVDLAPIEAAEEKIPVQVIDEEVPDVETLPEEVKEIPVVPIEEAEDDMPPAVVTEEPEHVGEPERTPFVEEEVDELPPVAEEVEEIKVQEERVPSEVREARAEETVEVDVTEEVSPAKKVVKEVEGVEEKVEVDVTVRPPKEDKAEAPEEVPSPEEETEAKVPEPEKEEVEVEVEVLPVEKEKVPELEDVEVKAPEKDEVEIEVEALPVEREKVPELEDVEVEVPEKEEIEVKIDVVPPEEEKEEITEVEVTVMDEIPPPAEEEVEVDVEILPEKEEEIGIEEEVRVPEEELEEIPEEEEVELEVEALPEEEKVEVEVEALPEEEEVEVEVEALPEEEEVEVEVEALPEEEEVEVEVEALPEEEEVEVEVEALPEEEKVEVEEEVLPEEEEVEVEVEVLPEEEKVEVEVEVLPEEEPELEDIVPTEEEVAEVPTEEVPPDLEEEVTTIPVMEIPEMPIPVPIPEVPVAVKPPIVEEFISCTCKRDGLVVPSKKIEVTQTEITQLEITQMEIIQSGTIQGITQTATDVDTQTVPPHRIVKRVHPPKFITITRTVDPDSELLGRLTRLKKPHRESSTVTTSTTGSQTVKSSLLRILQSLRAEETSSAHDPEQELKSVSYGRRADESEQAECDCCMCGKMVPSPSSRSRCPAEDIPSPIMRLLSTLPEFSTMGSPGIDRAAQHEAVCPECKFRRFREHLRNQLPPKQQNKVPRKPMRDQQVYACSSSCCKRPPLQEPKQKIDQSCMVKISRLKVERTVRKELLVEKVIEEKGAQEKKDSREKDSWEKDSREKDSWEKDSREKDSREKDSWEKDSREKDSWEKDSREKDSREKDSWEKDSREKDSWEKDSREKDSREKDSWEKGSREKDSWEKDSREKDSREKDSREKDSWEKDSREKDSWEKDSREKDSREKDSWEKDSREKDSWEKDSREKDSREKDSWEKDSREKDSREKDAQEKVPVPKDQDEDSVDCICSATVETGERGGVKKVRCACGDPD